MELRARLATVVGVWLAAALTACGEPGASDGDHHDYGVAENLGSEASSLVASDPVSAVIDSGCGTAALMPLSTQLVEEIDCLSPGALVSFREPLGAGIEAGSSVFPFLQSHAVDSLAKVIAARGSTLQLNSGLRTLPQQFVLYRWYQLGRCGITLAATPGSSNHESGLAVDVQDNAGWRPFFLAEGWKWQGEVDPVHFDVAGGVNLRGLSIQAFQRLWNRNHPEDLIEEDGLYGDETEGKLTSSPIGGFPIGATCQSEPGPGQGGAATGGSAAGGAAGSSSGAGGLPAEAGTGGTGGSGASPGGGGTAGSGSAVEPTAGATMLGGSGMATPAAATAAAGDSAGCGFAGVARATSGAWLLLALLVLLRRRRVSRGSLVGAAVLLGGCSSASDEDPVMGSAGSSASVAGAGGTPAMPSAGAPSAGMPPAVGSAGSSAGAGGATAGSGGMITAPEQCRAATVSCENEAQCCEGLACDMTSLGQVCCGNEGVSCNTENGEDCCGDLLCLDGLCTSPLLEPLTCEAPCKAAPALALERSRLEDVIGGSWLGICGDVNHTYGYHVPAANLPASDYSLEGDANEPVCEWYASAIDIGMDWPASRDWLRWLIEGIQTGRLHGIGEVIGSYDGDNVRYWSDSRGWSTEGEPYTGSGHDTWTHVSIHRSTAHVDHRILAGWTATGLEP